MPCPHCKDTSLTAIDSRIDYVEEPYSFSEGTIVHDHDRNPRVTLWRCKNGHEFELRGIKNCFGCTLERQQAIIRDQQRQEDELRASLRPPPGLSGHDRGFDSFSGPGPSMA